MRKARVFLVLVMAGLLASVLAIPSQAVQHTTVTTSQSVAAPEAPTTAQWTTTGWKLGALPAQATLCVANGIGGTYPYKYLIEQINNTSWGPNISVLNRCDGYSITNRMTIEAYTDTGTTACSKYTNTHRTYNSTQGKYIWDENVVLWYNLSTYCIGDDTVRAHRVGMFMEYILGLNFDTGSGNINAVICATTWCYYNVKYVQYEDRRRLGYIYGVEA